MSQKVVSTVKKKKKRRSEAEMLCTPDIVDQKRMTKKSKLIGEKPSPSSSSLVSLNNPALVPDEQSPASTSTGTTSSGRSSNICYGACATSNSPMAPRFLGGDNNDNEEDKEEEQADEVVAEVPEDDILLLDDDHVEDDDDEEQPQQQEEEDEVKLEPDNVLANRSQLFNAIEKYFLCPHCKTQNIEAKHTTVGFATTIDIECKQCSKLLVAIEPTIKDDEPAVSKRRGFLDYIINYSAVLLMQQLGVSIKALEIVLAHLGIAASSGNYQKWKLIQDIIGRAEQQLCHDVMQENLKEEVELAKESAKATYTQWQRIMEQEGASATTEAQKVSKMRELLNFDNGKIGIPIASDGAWQKRSLGRHSMNSSTGHNYAVGGRSKKILNMVVYSQRCMQCYLADKNGKEPPPHRCGKNYEEALSAKAMEGKATVQHCIDIHSSSAAQAYVHTLVTDDDSTVRANTKHSYKAVAIRDYGLNFKKKDTDWPWRYDSKVEVQHLEDRGKLPLQVTPVKEWWSDVGHRVKLIGSVAFGLEGKSKKKLKAGTHLLHRGECLQLKRSAGYYFKDPANLDQGFDLLYCQRANCFYLHLFNDHSQCNVSWCKILQGRPQRRSTETKILMQNYSRRWKKGWLLT